MVAGVVPAPLLGAPVTLTKEVNVAVLGLIVPAEAATIGATTVHVAVPEDMEPPEKVNVLPEIVAVPPHELVTVAPEGKLKPAGKV